MNQFVDTRGRLTDDEELHIVSGRSKRKWYLTLPAVVGLIFVLMIPILVYATLLGDVPGAASKQTNYLRHDWTYERDEEQLTLTVSRRINSNMRGRAIGFRSYDSYVTADLDGETIYAYDLNPHIGKSPGTWTHLIGIPWNAPAGATLTIRIKTVYPGKYQQNYDFMYGDRNELIFNYLYADFPAMIANILCVMFGLVLLIVTFAGLSRHVFWKEYLYLGLVSIGFALYNSCSMFYSQFIMRNGIEQYYMTYFELYLLTVLVMLYLEQIIPRFHVAVPFWLVTGIAALNTLLHFTSTLTYTETIKLLTGAIGLLALYTLVLIFLRLKRMSVARKVSLGILLGSVMINIVYFIFGHTTGNQAWIMQVGIMAYLLISIVYGMRRLMNEMYKLGQVEYLEEIAYIDPLTGLQNRFAAMQELQRISFEKMGVISFDMNDLKFYNDSYGHSQGDDMLRTAADILRTICGEEHIYRIGGDEFLAFYEGKSLSDLEDICDKVHDRCAVFAARASHHGTAAGGPPFSIACGPAVYTQEDTTRMDVTTRADKNMYLDKKRIKEAFCN